MRVPNFVGDAQIHFADKPVPQPGAGQLLLKVGANALCGSERGQFYKGTATTPGHEAAGVVVATGPNTHTAIGQHGVVFLMDFCGECRCCSQGFTNQCLNKRGDMGFNRDGGYGPYMLVNETIFFAIDAAIAPAEATLLLDIMGTGGHAIARGRCVHPDIASVLIMGAGPIGLGVLAMCKLLLGDVPVAIADVLPYRLKLAETLGGLPVDLIVGDVEAGLRRHGWAHADLAIDTSGKAVARAAAMQALDKRGVLVCVGHGQDITLDVSSQLIAPERAVLGSEYFCFDELPANLARLREHRRYLAQIITHRYPAAEVQTAFETFFAGSTGKVIIEHEAA